MKKVHAHKHVECLLESCLSHVRERAHRESEQHVRAYHCHSIHIHAMFGSLHHFLPSLPYTPPPCLGVWEKKREPSRGREMREMKAERKWGCKDRKQQVRKWAWMKLLIQVKNSCPAPSPARACHHWGPGIPGSNPCCCLQWACFEVEKDGTLRLRLRHHHSPTTPTPNTHSHLPKIVWEEYNNRDRFGSS